MTDQPKISRKEAMRLARRIGCQGAHQNEKGEWLPCSSPDELQKISKYAETHIPSGLKDAETKAPPCIGCKESAERTKRGRSHRKRWEKLRERGVVGIETMPNGGLVSAPVAAKELAPGVKRERVVLTEKSEQKEIVESKSRFDYFARDGDLDGMVQDGTPNERRSRTLTSRTIGRRKKPVTRTRLRDLPFPYPETPTPEV